MLIFLNINVGGNGKYVNNNIENSYRKRKMEERKQNDDKLGR